MNSRRYYIAPVGGIPVSEQEEMARGQGLKDGDPVYLETKKSNLRERGKLFESFRPKGTDEHVWVSDFVVLVPRRKLLKTICAALKKKRAYIHEGRTGRSSRNASEYAGILHDAIDYWGRGRLPHHLAVEYGEKGGRQFARNRRQSDNRMPKGEAVKYWRDAKFTNAQDALDAINSHNGYKEEWTRSAAYRSLGERQLPTGPRGPWKR